MWPFAKKKEDNSAAPTETHSHGAVTDGAAPTEAAKPAQSRNARADLLWKTGSRYLGRKQYLKAIASFQEAYELEPSRLEGRLNLGAALYLAQRPEEALGHLKYVLALEPQNTMALLNLAATYDSLGLIDESIATLEKLVHDRPNWGDANYNLAVAYLKQERLDDATTALRRELTLNPKHEAARTLLNEVHLKPRRKPKQEENPGETEPSETSENSESSL
jgi:tetratricopeptide (TPR) repeat protein